MANALVRLLRCHPDRWPEFQVTNLEVVFVDDCRIAALNQEFLRHRGPTDVIAFNLESGTATVVISLDAAARQAKTYGQTFQQELTLYLVHGMLHLAGFEDATVRQRRRMQGEEQWILNQLRRPH
jgi:probable rRNA maturation factor